MIANLMSEYFIFKIEIMRAFYAFKSLVKDNDEKLN